MRRGVSRASRASRWGDDIGIANLSCYTRGLMGCQTPTIDIDYPRAPEFKQRFGPRGVLHCWATDTDDPTEEPRWGRVGKQKIEDTGPLTRKRMETCDDEFVAAARDFIKRQHEAGRSRSIKRCRRCRTRSTAAIDRVIGHRVPIATPAH
jgi:arylsulfatase A-like enzyme